MFLKLDTKTMNNLVKIDLKEDVGVIKETLTRLGIADNKRKILWQSCHLICVRKQWYLVFFKEIFYILGRDYNLREGDIERRNEIAMLLEDWDLIKILNREFINFSWDGVCDPDYVPNTFKLKHSLKGLFDLRSKVDMKTFNQFLHKYHTSKTGYER